MPVIAVLSTTKYIIIQQSASTIVTHSTLVAAAENKNEWLETRRNQRRGLKTFWKRK